MATGVYQIRNLTNGKCYIGSASAKGGFERRWYLHKYHLNKRQHHSIHLQRAWSKHGSDAFVFEVLLYCDPKDCLTYEQFALDGYKSEYNICKIASSRLGVKASKQSLARMRKAKRGQHTGSKNPRAILNENQARQIKILLRVGLNEHQIAPRFSVSAAVIKRIKYNKSWKHVTITMDRI